MWLLLIISSSHPISRKAFHVVKLPGAPVCLLLKGGLLSDSFNKVNLISNLLSRICLTNTCSLLIGLKYTIYKLQCLIHATIYTVMERNEQNKGILPVKIKDRENFKK